MTRTRGLILDPLKISKFMSENNIKNNASLAERIMEKENGELTSRLDLVKKAMTRTKLDLSSVEVIARALGVKADELLENSKSVDNSQSNTHNTQQNAPVTNVNNDCQVITGNTLSGNISFNMDKKNK